VGPLNDRENNLISSNEEMVGIQKEFFAKRGMGLSSSGAGGMSNKVRRLCDN
jgi:hypothetical protein